MATRNQALRWLAGLALLPIAVGVDASKLRQEMEERRQEERLAAVEAERDDLLRRMESLEQAHRVMRWRLADMSGAIRHWQMEGYFPIYPRQEADETI